MSAADSLTASAPRAGTQTGEALALRNVTQSYRQGAARLDVLRGVDLTIAKGECVALIGPSGAGKSTLLHISGLLESPSSGDVVIDGVSAGVLGDKERTRMRRDKLGFVYQFHQLLPEFTALENVVLPQLIAGRTRAAAEKEARRLLSTLGLAERLEHRPSELSGGEQQRVATGRALANRPQILLADEPTGNLDPGTAALVFDQILGVVRREGLAALVATHNLELATHMDRAVQLENGRLIETTAKA